MKIFFGVILSYSGFEHFDWLKHLGITTNQSL